MAHATGNETLDAAYATVLSSPHGRLVFGHLMAIARTNTLSYDGSAGIDAGRIAYNEGRRYVGVMLREIVNTLDRDSEYQIAKEYEALLAYVPEPEEDLDSVAVPAA